MNHENPKISVLMPVYNGEKYLKESIDSILSQTFTDFEFLLIVDPSTDNSVSIIESYSDSRIIPVYNEQNLGLIGSLNKGLDLARGEYIARMDSDDISLPQRFEKQISFMESHPDIGICGCWHEDFGEVSPKIFKYPVAPEIIKCKLFFFSTFSHPSVMIRKSLIKKHNLYYSPEYKYVEDFELWQRCSFLFSMANIPEVLVRYRINSEGATGSFLSQHNKALIEIDRKSFKLLGLEVSDEELEFHQRICPLRRSPMLIDKDFVIKADTWLQKILKANQDSKIYSQSVFSQLIAERWFVICNLNAEKYGLWVWKKFIQSPLSRKNIGFRQKAKLFMKCLIKGCSQA